MIVFEGLCQADANELFQVLRFVQNVKNQPHDLNRDLAYFSRCSCDLGNAFVDSVGGGVYASPRAFSAVRLRASPFCSYICLKDLMVPNAP